MSYVSALVGCIVAKKNNTKVMYASLMSAVWGLEPQYHNSVFEVALKRLAAGKDAVYVLESRKAGRPTLVPVVGRVGGLSVAGNVKVISIDGVMSRAGDWCSHGTEQLSAWIKEANADSNVAAIMLKINSGGGDVDGTEQLGQVIKASKKPVVAYVAGMAASAAYWVASQCSEVIMETATTSRVGSIGVLAIHVDSTKYLEKEGHKVSIIRADGSEDKSLYNSLEGLNEQVLAETKAELNKIRDTFVSYVKAGRAGVSERAFSGKMYNGNEAIKEKLADRIETYEGALGRAMYYARKQELNNNSNNKTNSKAMDYPKLEAVLGGSVPEGLQDETALAVETELTKNDNKIAELEAKIVGLEGEKTAAEAVAAKLADYEKTGLSAAEAAVAAKWHREAKNANATGQKTDATEEGKGRKMSAATAKANEVYRNLHGNKEN